MAGGEGVKEAVFIGVGIVYVQCERKHTKCHADVAKIRINP